MKKSLSAILAFTGCSLIMSGCSLTNAYSEDDYDIVSTYIAQSLIKQDSELAYRLVTIQRDSEDENNKENVEPTAEPTVKPSELPQQQSTDKPNKNQTTDKDDTKGDSSLATVLGISNANITFKNYKTYSSYDDSYFAIEPQDGKELIMLTYTIKNTGSKKTSVKLTPDKKTYCLSVDGKDYKPLMTAMDNDMLYYEANIESGKSKKAVIVFQIDKKSKLQDVTVSIKSDAGTYSEKIK